MLLALMYFSEGSLFGGLGAPSYWQLRITSRGPLPQIAGVCSPLIRSLTPKTLAGTSSVTSKVN